MRPINNNYISVDSKDIVDKHDRPRAMCKWSNKENQKRMIKPIVGVARVFTLACADEHLLRNLESLVAVQIMCMN